MMIDWDLLYYGRSRRFEPPPLEPPPRALPGFGPSRPVVAAQSCDLAYFFWSMRDVPLPPHLDCRVDRFVTRGQAVLLSPGDERLFGCKAAIVELYNSPERQALAAERGEVVLG